MWQKWVGEDSRTCCRFPSTLVWQTLPQQKFFVYFLSSAIHAACCRVTGYVDCSNVSCRTLPTPGIVCVCVGRLTKFLFARCCAFLFTSVAVALERTRVACYRHFDEDVCTEFLICACKCATYFCRLINNYTVAVMIRTSCFQSLAVYELCVVIRCFVGSIRRYCSQEVLLYYGEVCSS